MKKGKTVYARPTIIPLGTQEKSLKERYDERLKELNFKPWSPDTPNQPNTCIDFVLNGDHDRMTEIAFGKPMDFDWREDNSSVTLTTQTIQSANKLRPWHWIIMNSFAGSLVRRMSSDLNVIWTKPPHTSTRG